MDLVTQGLLGATLAQSAAPRGDLRAATGVGVVAGLLPDADTLVRSAADPLLALEAHRFVTHALLFIPLGALLVAGLLWPLRRRLGLSGLRLYAYAVLGMAGAGVLDACTSYGTHLLWPFAGPVSWSIVAIVDPVPTLALLLCAVGAWRRRRARWAHVGLAVLVAYLALGTWQHHRAEQAARAWAASQGHTPSEMVVKPTLANLVLWRDLYARADTVHVAAVRVGTGAPTVTPGETAPLVHPEAIPATPAQQDALRRFARLSEGWLVQHPTRPRFIGDVRFAMLPTSARPLWGVELVEPDTNASPYRVETDRTLSDAERDRLMRMLRNAR